MTVNVALRDAPEENGLSEGIFLGRQPILDRDRALVAFELLFRSGTTNAAAFVDGTAATATVLNHVLNEFGLDSVLGPYRGFINLDEPMLMSDMIEVLPRDKVVLEVLETVPITPAVVARCEALRRAGFTLALDDVTHVPSECQSILQHVSIVKVDLVQLDAAGLEGLVRDLAPWPLTLLAEKVDESAQFEQCLDLGFGLFQGYFFAKPEILEGKRLSPAEATLLRLLGLVLGDAETHEIERVLKQEPMLTVNLIRLVNSVASGVRTRITSLSAALIALGRRQLTRWLQILLYTSGAAGRMPSPLMLLAATRAKTMELVAAGWRDKDLEDQAFLTGIMSLIDALLGVPLEQLVDTLPLTDAVRDAVTTGGGRLGELLALARLLEGKDDAAVSAQIAGMPGLSPGVVEAAHAEAMRWASTLAAT